MLITINFSYYLPSDLNIKMGKTRAEIQKAYRQRKKEQMGEEAFLKKEANRVKRYYVPVEQLSQKERKTRREGVAQRVGKHRAWKKKDHTE